MTAIMNGHETAGWLLRDLDYAQAQGVLFPEAEVNPLAAQRDKLPQTYPGSLILTAECLVDYRLQAARRGAGFADGDEVLADNLIPEQPDTGTYIQLQDRLGEVYILGREALQDLLEWDYWLMRQYRMAGYAMIKNNEETYNGANKFKI